MSSIQTLTANPFGLDTAALFALPRPASAIFYTEDEAAALRDEALDEWRAALSK